MTDTHCDSCGARVIWITDQNGTRVPLNKVRARMYEVWDHQQGCGEYETKTDGTPRLRYISHFLSCPNAAAHSKKR